MIYALALLPGSLFAHGELDIRLAAATRAIAAETNNAALYVARGELHREHKDWSAALADYATAERLDPALPQLDFLRGRMFADADQLDEARARLDLHLARQPEDGLAYIERARVWARQNQHTNAVADFTRGLQRLREPQPEHFIERAQALLADDQVEAALAGVDEGVKKLGPLVTFQAFALEVELKRKNFDGALTRLESIIAQSARPERWLAQRGEIELQAGRPEAARRSFTEALAAIARLPVRLQTLPPMMNLKAHIQALQDKAAVAPSE
jgi:tetratricopeptide (TPR) repeat protein